MLVQFFIYFSLRYPLSEYLFPMCLKTECLAILPCTWVCVWHGHWPIKPPNALQIHIGRFLQGIHLSCHTLLTQGIHLFKEVICIQFTSHFNPERVDFGTCLGVIFIVGWIICFIIGFYWIGFNVIYDLVFCFVLFVDIRSFIGYLV